MPHPILPVRTSESPTLHLAEDQLTTAVEKHAKVEANGHHHHQSLNGDSRLEPRHGTMKAVIWDGRPGHVSVRHVPKPQIQKDSELLIRITTAASE